MTVAAIVHSLFPFAVALAVLWFGFKLARYMFKIFLILVVFTMMGSGLVYTPEYQQIIHFLLG